MRILIADQNELLRRGLMQVVSSAFGNSHISEADTLAGAMERLNKARWDLAIVDYSFPDGFGIGVVAETKKPGAYCPVLIVSDHPDASSALKSLRAGAAGYSGKRGPISELTQAIKIVAEGGQYLPPSLFGTASVVDAEGGGPPHKKLGAREFEVFRLTYNGLAIREIASMLEISPKTVSNIRRSIYKKLHIRNIRELIRYGVEYGIAA